MLLHKTSLDARRAESAASGGTFTFPGLHVNAIDEAPPERELPWRQCVSTAWINRFPLKRSSRDNDVQLVPILDVIIPDSMFSEGDLLWLEEDNLDSVPVGSESPGPEVA